MKKLFLFLLSVILVFSMIGCGSSSGEEQTKGNASGEVNREEEIMRVRAHLIKEGIIHEDTLIYQMGDIIELSEGKLDRPKYGEPEIQSRGTLQLASVRWSTETRGIWVTIRRKGTTSIKDLGTDIFGYGERAIIDGVEMSLNPPWYSDFCRDGIEVSKSREFPVLGGTYRSANIPIMRKKETRSFDHSGPNDFFVYMEKARIKGSDWTDIAWIILKEDITFE